MAEPDHGRQDREEGEESDVKVTDRRMFTADGQLRQELPEDEDEATPEHAEPAPPVNRTSNEPAAEQQAGFEHRSVEEPQGVDFTMLVNAMAQPALLFLGEIPHPGTGQAQVDLEQAQIQVDMLELLLVKCRGNLSRDEESLLERILYQLRMLYVSRSSAPPPASPTP